MATSRGKQTLVQRIALDGGKEIQKELEALGKEGAAAFQHLKAAAEQTNGASTQFSQNLLKMRQSAVAVGESVDKLKAKFSFFGGEVARVGAIVAGAFSVHAIVDMTSAWTDLTSRVKFSIDAHEDAAQVMDRLSDIAQRTYSDLQLTVDGFARNAQVLGELGLSTQKQLDFQEALNDALVVSGAKGDRARQVQEAITKAMATGTLRGDELNSVLRQGGRIAQLLAEKLNTTTGGLLKLGQEGQITGQVLQDVLIGNLAKLRDEADAMPATIEDGFLRIRNALLKYIGTANEASGVGNAIAQGLIFISEHVDVLVGSLAGLVGAFLAVKGVHLATDILDIAKAMRQLAIDMLPVIAEFAATPFGAVALGIAALAAAIVGLLALTGNLGGFVEFLQDAVGQVVQFVTENMGTLKQIGDSVISIFQSVGSILKSLADVALIPLKGAVDAVNSAFGTNLEVIDLLRGALKLISLALQVLEIGFKAIALIVKDTASGIKSLSDTIARFFGAKPEENAPSDQMDKLKASTDGAAASFQNLAKIQEDGSFGHKTLTELINGWENYRRAIVKAGKSTEEFDSILTQSLEQEGLQISQFYEDGTFAITFLQEQAVKATENVAAETAKQSSTLADYIVSVFQNFAGSVINFLAPVKDFIKSIMDAAQSLGDVLGGLFGGGGDGEEPQENAQGGLIRGRGTGTSDSILSWLSNGEFVVRADAVRKYGTSFMRALNGMTLPRFASGGLVSGLTSAVLPGAMPVPAVIADGAGGGTGTPLTLVIGGETFDGLLAPETVASKLKHYAVKQTMRTAGHKPSWYRG